jgi:MscS family membrane protein
MRRLSSIAAAACFAVIALTPLSVCAQTEQAVQAGASSEEGNSDTGTPRASVADFLALCRAGRYVEAARYLMLSDVQRPRAAELSKRLKAVLDRHLWVNLEHLSDQVSGDVEDDLPPGVDEVGHIKSPSGVSVPVRVAKIIEKGESRWVFSRGTVRHVDALYSDLSQRWLLEHLPEPLLRTGPGDVLFWQWLVFPFLAALAWVLGLTLSRIVRAALASLTARTVVGWDDALLSRMASPLTLVGMLGVFAAGVGLLDLHPPAAAFCQRLLRVLFLGSVFWMLARCVDVAAHVAASSPWGSRAAAGSLVKLGARISKVGVVVLAVIALLSAWGYSVASLLAGLGIGGLAVALAAQKTVENLFGAFSIGVDQPFREGDFVRIEDFVGTVEQIGLRSTKIRTLDRTLISLPNGKLADMRLESFSARDRIRLACTLGLVYETTPAQMRTIVAALETALRAHPKIWPDAVVVRFVGLGDFSLNVDVMAWFLTSDWNEFQNFRQELLLQFMEIVEQAGSAFAFPTQTLHMVSDGQSQNARPTRLESVRLKTPPRESS